MDELTGSDYMTRPYIELASHPDFDSEVWNLICMLKELKTKQLKNVQLFGGYLDG